MKSAKVWQIRFESFDFYAVKKTLTGFTSRQTDTPEMFWKQILMNSLKYSRKYITLFRLKGMGYKVNAPVNITGTSRVRHRVGSVPFVLDSTGYTPEALISRFEAQQEDFYFFQLQTSTPLLAETCSVWRALSKIWLLRWNTATIPPRFFVTPCSDYPYIGGYSRWKSGSMLLSPDLRYEVKNYKTYAADYHYLNANRITRYRSWKQQSYRSRNSGVRSDRQKVSNHIRGRKNRRLRKTQNPPKRISAQ
jgi:hypothetical protein